MTEELAAAPSAASRQTSCHACARGKRACDKRHPACARCAEKKLHCVYAKRTHAEAFGDFAALDVAWAGFAASPSSSANDFVDADTLHGGDPPGRRAPLSPRLELPPPTLAAFKDPFLGFTEDDVASPGDMQLVSSAGGEPFGQQQQSEQALSTFDYSPMADLCIHYEPWQVYDPTTKAHYLVHALKSYPLTLATSSHTPWLHPSLYRAHQPASMRACLAATALYAATTPASRPAALRVLCHSLADLLLLQPRTPLETLARAQALFVYQIVGLFDGDVTLRSRADRNMPLLHAWLDELCGIREEAECATGPPTSWESWIFAESVRRTLVIAYAFLGLWSTMTQRTDAIFFAAWQHRHPWTLARPLWEAPSAFDFFRAWTAAAPRVVVNFEVDDFLRGGGVGEVDEFARVFVVAYLGLDGTRQWFEERGGVF